ncbi:hypothetical protein P148_SR1C00001G0128 [candidate division SR1 bacterium RAAC1_SR1_1]|nr:hypothetical protein P148_SR1C00001G0128 [candidate division SR1 bacterium RAAC1_SR1_1]
MKRWIILIISLLFLTAGFIILWRFPVRNILDKQHENNEKILELKKEITEIKDQFNLLEPISLLGEEELALSGSNEEIAENQNIQEETISKPKDTISPTNKTEEITTEINPTPTTILKKIGYITNVFKDNSIAKISFDEIIILPKEECEGLEICFKNESKKTITFMLTDTVEIYSYFVNYLVDGEIRKLKKILLPCFLEFFTEDDVKDYTRFNKIPYWITLNNGKITKIEEQNVVGLY